MSRRPAAGTFWWRHRVASALRSGLALLLSTLLAVAAAAAEARPDAADPALEARMLRIAAELRCLVCQNQTIADSDASLAVDLRRETRELLRQGKSDADVIDYMTARYGDFVLYRPPLKGTTALLWFGPAVLLLGGATVLVLVLRRRSRLGPDAFEPDLEGDGDDAAAAPASRRAGAR
jgi:cytochrome c-type biogenesis protein CcmH